MSGKQINRREFVRASVAAGASAALWSAPAITQGTARVVVVGGGFAGATCARRIKRLDPTLHVTLVETNPTFTACPFSNEVVAGLRDIKVHWMPILPARWQRWQPWVESQFARALLRHVPFLGLVCCHAFLVEGRRPGRTA